MIFVFLFVMCGLTCGVFANASLVKTPKGKFSVPSLDVQTQQLIVEANKTLQLNCRGRWELSWAFPQGLAMDRRPLVVVDTRCGRKGLQHCSRLTLSPSQAQHTGSYRCRYRNQRRHSKQTSVYVYVTDSQRPFVMRQGRRPDVLFMNETLPLVFPCRVTHPNVTALLVKYPDHRLGPDRRNILWDSRKGFTIRSPNYQFYTGLFYCQATVDGVTHSSHMYYVHRSVTKIKQVYLNSSRPVQALKGERLVLNCTVKAELNTRVNFSWDYPRKRNHTASITSKFLGKGEDIWFDSILTIPKLQRGDRGMYTCIVTSGENIKTAKVEVTVYDRPFIRLKARQGAVLEANLGQKSYRLAPKLRAFPAPEVIWLKDGMVAAEMCSRYSMEKHSLVIRDVAEEDAGKYTILVRIPEHGRYQNLTLTLVVNVSPQIGEKAVSVQDPGTVPRGSRQALHCTSHGVPSPQVQWLWHPCPSKGLSAAAQA